MNAETERSRLPWVVVAIAAPGLAATLVFSGINGSFREDAAFIGVAVVMMLGYCGVGALVASRAHRNPVGWLMMAFGIGFLIGALTDEFGRFAIERGGAPLDAFAYWLTAWIFLVVIVSLPLMLLYFPDGELLSPRWRWAVRFEVAVGAAATLLSMFAPGPIELEVPDPPDNPLGVDALSGIANVGWLLFILLALVGLFAAVSIVLRYRRSEGTDRQRMRLFTSVVALSLLLAVAGTVIGGDIGGALFLAFFFAIGVGIPAAMAIAILRFQMFDVEVVIRKTVRFAIVAALLALTIGAVLFSLGGPLVGILVVPYFEDEGMPFFVSGIVSGLLALPLLRVSRRIADRIVFGGRATPYEVLTEFSQRVGESYSTEDVLPRMAAVLGTAVGAERADIWLGVGASLRHAAGWPEGASPISPGDDTCAISYQGEELGSLSVLLPANDPMNESKERLMADLAAQAGPVIRNVRLVEDLRESRRRIVTAQDERARRLERDIHDGAQQQLVALAVHARLARSVAERDPSKVPAMLAQIQEGANDALENLRDLARGIYPPLLADQGLAAAIEAQARKAAMPVTVSADGVARYAQDVEAAVYFCTLEALNNVAKYAEATRVDVRLGAEEGALRFEIIDDGIGFETSDAASGTGLQGMADRVAALGGSLTLTSARGQGTTVRGSVPT